jgi:cytochrome c-type biogenesis protein CcmH
VTPAPPPIGRRGFLAAAAAVLTAAATGRLLVAQAAPQPGGGAELPGSSMTGDGYLPVALPPKAGAARPSMSPNARDAVERQIACPCPCTLDIFTCRASMPCGFAPRLHRDVMGLVENGYSADEILAAFTDVYGQAIRMAPPKRGFNLVGWVAPFAAIGVGAVGVLALLRRWQRPAAPIAGAVTPIGVTATDEELRQLDAAVRRDRS